MVGKQSENYCQPTYYDDSAHTFRAAGYVFWTITAADMSQNTYRNR